ncbi:glycosyltransferase family 2 protein [Flavobacterium sp. CS20]|uniref:glycosyltransferase family 2 protein n=1 Tax=Flavobacterium sp. CS20 TaxID=2775246 RepID=UPI001B3A0F4A|nr:glycosyltransferase family 2 protein [Flavobacterium sp. CS20]QTY27005.1 glycosyltransferase family 2 protein [Flavobacterium sp. CS20]
MKVSVIIVSYKVPYHLMLCLESLNSAIRDLDAEIIVVDNASNDKTSELVSKYFPQVKFIQNPNNDGFSKANNIGINQAKGKYICLINPDTVISETSIKATIKKHESFDNCGILGLRLIDGTGHFLPESKINKLTLKVAALKMLGFSKQYYNNNLSEGEEGQTTTLVGAFMCFRKQDYERLEGLDERYFMYGEDIDLCYQFTKAGYQNYYLGKESLIHFKGESTLRDDVYFKRFFDSVKFFFTKHYSNSKLMIGILSIFFIIAKRFKKSDMLKKANVKPDYNNIFYIGQNKELYQKLKIHYNKNIKTLEPKQIDSQNYKDSLIVFDTKTLSYQRAIDFMLKNNNSGNAFRFIPQHLGVLIGSDSSTSQGEVVFLK